MAFDENKYKSIFEARYGSGSFESGLSQARQIGYSKVQADLAMAQLKKQREQAQKKTYQDAIGYWSDPLNKNSLKKDGAYRRANDILNDPTKQADIEAQGFNVNEYIDGMYYAASDGKFRSQREYGQHQTTAKSQAKSEQKARDEEYKSKYGMSYDEYYQFNKAQQESKKKEQSKKKKNGVNLLDDLIAAGKFAYQGFNPFDDVSMKDAFTEYTERDTSKAFDEVARGSNRTVDSASFGLMSNLDKKVNDRQPYYNSKREFGEGGGTDMLTSGLGYLVPGAGAYKALNATKLGKGLTQFGTKGVTQRIGSEAAKGAITGAGLAGTEVGVREGLNPQDYTAKQNLGLIGFGTVAGAVADPLLYGLGSAIRKALGKAPAQIADDVLGLPEPQRALPAPQQQALPAPQQLLPEPKPPLRQQFENEGINFGYGSRNAPKARQNLNPVEAPIDPMNRPTDYWAGRYEDFVKHVKDTGYTENNLSRESIEELWTQFAKYDEPVNIEQVVDLAYPKGNVKPPVPETPVVAQPEIPVVQQPVPKQQNIMPELTPTVRATEKTDLLMSLNPSVLKTVRIDKGLEKMSKEELQGLATQLSAKQQTVKGKKQLAAVQADLEKVNQFLMKLDLQQFGLKTPKIEPPKPMKELTPNIAQKKSEIKEPVASKQSKQDYAISQNKQKKLVKEFEEKGNPVKTEAAKDLTNSDKWTDKSAFGFGRETITRNFENVMGEDAPKMIAKYIDPVKSSEAERIRFLNKERTQVKSYEIKPKSNEDKLVQMYGEKKISLVELKQKTTEWKKVVKVAESYRNKYDELLTTVNKALVESGHKPIPKRSDYFPHYEEMDGLLKQFGLDVHNHSLPTDINGLTENFRPTKQYFQFGNQRKGDETTFGAIQGFDKYIEGASNLIYHTKNIRRLRGLEDVIRAKYGDDHLSNFVSQLKEYTNQLAGKKAKVDRIVEETFGRKIYNVADTIRRKVGANMIGANISSSLTGFIPTTQALSTTNKASMVKGMAETIANIRKSDGFIQKSDFLTKRIGSDPLYRTLWDKTIDKSMWMMRTVDSFNAQIIVRGKYNEGIKKGLSEQAALKQADEFAARVMAARSKGEMPTLFGSKTFGIVSQFQLEVNNQLSFIFKDIPASASSKKALASSVGQLVLYSYLFNNVYEKVVGRRPAFDPMGIAIQATKDYNNDNLTKGDATLNLTKNIAGSLPFSSVVTGGRFPISAAKPEIDDALSGKSTWTEELSKPLTYLGLPAGGSQLKKTYEGLTAMDLNPFSPQGTTGVYQDGKMKFPVEGNIPNHLKGALFGKNAFSETKEFYDNKRRNLSEKQTFQVENSAEPKETYENLMFKRRIETIQAKIKDVQKNPDLSVDEKRKKVLSLIQQLQQLGG
jgi:hypothetical protein